MSEKKNQYYFNVSNIYTLVKESSSLSRVVTEFLSSFATQVKEFLDIDMIMYLEDRDASEPSSDIAMNELGVLLFASDSILFDSKAPLILKDTIKEVKTTLFLVVGENTATGKNDGLVEEIMKRVFQRKSDLKKITTFLQSNDFEDLQQGRLLTREILNDITSKMFDLFCQRDSLMGLIASSKRHSESIVQMGREYDLMKDFSRRALVQGMSPDMVEMFIWIITAAGKEKQRSILKRDSVFVKENLSRQELLSNLLELTRIVAKDYNTYGNGFDATLLSRDLEDDMIEELVGSIQNKGVCLDLGCANGKTTEFLSKLGFERVIGYDVSSDMIASAQKYKISDTLEYIKHDLFDGIPVKDESVDCIISNLGSASEVHDNIFSEVSRVLRKGGKAFLSFYNDKALMNGFWSPSQGSMQVVVNPEDDIIEVPVLSQSGKNKVFKIYARKISDTQIQSFANEYHLKIESLKSHSLVSSMVSPIFFKDEKRTESMKQLEKGHASGTPYKGPYITVCLSKES